VTDLPTLSPIVDNKEGCDFDFLGESLDNTLPEFGDDQWVKDCRYLIDTRDESPSVVCACIGKFWKGLANQYLNCMLSDTWHGIAVWNLCMTINNQGVTDRPTLSPIVDNTEGCDFDFLGESLDNTLPKYGDDQWVKDCRYLLDSRDESPSVACPCIGKFWQGLANQYLNCMLTDDLHGIAVWNFCITRNNQGVTDPPTSPMVVNRETCDFESLKESLENTLTKIGDDQWVNACRHLLDTKSQDIPEVCACIGRFPQSMANQYLNCMLTQTYYGIAIWNMCQTWGSQDDRRRTTGVNDKFRLNWKNELCEPTPTPTKKPTDEPTPTPTKKPTDEPTPYPTPTPTKTPTDEPTTACQKYETWTESRAIQICKEGSWGKTDRGYSSMRACDPDLQSKLEESAANRLFRKCVSWCIYDYSALLKKEQVAYKWKKDLRCWTRVTAYMCFNQGYADFVDLQDVAAAICQK